jgi:CMP/dCMP kinase
VITIDGPAGAGKSTVAQALAQRLGYRLLDTGAMYRALAWSVDQAGLTAEDTPALRRHLSGVEVEVRSDRVHVDGRDVSGEIRTRAIDKLTSALTTLEPVRQMITPLQRRLSAAGGVILEGRDTGTVVCPDAEVKFFLDASLEVRARRRQAQFAARGLVADLATVLDEVRARDAQDTTRALAPLTRAPDAVAIDSTDLTVEQIVERMVREIERRCFTQS